MGVNLIFEPEMVCEKKIIFLKQIRIFDPNLLVDSAEMNQHRLYTLTEAKKGR